MQRTIIRHDLFQSSTLTEATRMQMIQITKDYSEERYDRRKGYIGKVKSYLGSAEYTNEGSFSLLIEVGDYINILEIRGMKSLVDERIDKGVPSRSQAGNLLRESISILDMGVFCTCDDFKYRFHYKVTKEGALPSDIKGQDEPARITNPGDEGFVCKHLTAVMTQPSRWIPKAITFLREAIKEDRAQRDDRYSRDERDTRYDRDNM